jgi:aryl-alcohol dehydrogenase-like predicted oxidoreductase
VEALTETASKAGMSLLEFSLTWLAMKDEVDSVISGASKFDHVVQNLDIIDKAKEIPQELLVECDDVWNHIRGQYFNYHQ